MLLVGHGKEGAPNAMAIGWGTIGIIWRRPIFTVLVRPSRYTYKLIEQTNDFTVNIVGTVSGRDHNKFKEKHITAIPSHKIRAPIIKECLLHFECRVIYKNDLIQSKLEKSIIPTLYPKG